jgi:hypothetical protein
LQKLSVVSVAPFSFIDHALVVVVVEVFYGPRTSPLIVEEWDRRVERVKPLLLPATSIGFVGRRLPEEVESLGVPLVG